MTENYKIVRKLGQGGFGNVFLVRNGRNEHVVIKTVPLKSISKYVINELNILKSLDHPRIVKLIDFFPSYNDYNFVLEYAEKGTLRDLIYNYQEQRWKLSVKDLIEIFMELAYGVRYLHSKKIIHRDVKPENVLLTKGYRVKLADFGVSKIVGECCPNVHTSIGTLSYMSPEVYLQQPYDKSADMWALGLIFYELAFLKYPFDKIDKCRILNAKLTYSCPKPDWVARKYDEGMQYILEMMLQRDPRKRRDIEIICRHPLFVPYFKELENEYAEYCCGKKTTDLRIAKSEYRNGDSGYCGSSAARIK